MYEQRGNSLKYIKRVEKVAGKQNSGLVFRLCWQMRSLIFNSAFSLHSLLHRIPYDATFVPVIMCHYLDSARKCLCGSACFEVYLHHMAALNLRHIAATVTAVDKEGTLTVPVEMFLCRARCLKFWKKS